MTTFSVVIPTRNRPALLRTALGSVLAQSGGEFEVIVVNDGTSGPEETGLDAVKAEYAASVTFVDLPKTSTGHGCFRVMNTGAALSRGEYVCFLDDDDHWTDTAHLDHARRIVQGEAATVDAIFFDQAAYRGETRAEGPIWLDDLGARLRAAGDHAPGHAFAVDVDTLLTAHGFAHTNITIVHRAMFDRIGGFDAGLRYEGDRDFFLRLIDAATTLRYAPTICSRHNIPVKASASTTTTDLNKALDQIRLLHKAAHHARHPAIAAYATRHRRFAMRKALDAALGRPVLLLDLVRFLPTLLTKPASSTEVAIVPASQTRVTTTGERLP